MNVAHVTFSGKFGGRDRVAFSLVEVLKGQVNATLYLVIETRAKESDREALINIVANYGIPVRIFYTNGVFSIDTLRELGRAASEDGINVVHAHCNKSILYALLLQKLYRMRIRSTYTLHGLLLAPTLGNLVYFLGHYLSLYLADGVIACSRQLAEQLEFLPGLRHLEIIQNSIPITAELPSATDRAAAKHAIAERYGVSAAAVYVGNVCRLEEEKNLPLFLASIGRIRDEQGDAPAAVFFVVGDGSLRQALEETARYLQIQDRVVFTGFVANMQQLYTALDIAALTSDREGTPMCLLEAMQYGLPVVASRVGGVPDVIREGVDGVLFEKGDEAGLARQMLSLLADPNHRQSLGRNGRQHMELDLSPQTWAERHTAHYLNLFERA